MVGFRIGSVALVVALALIFVGCKDASLDAEVTGGIEGVVVHDETGDPVEGVEMTTTPPSDVRITEANGSFAFEDLEVGDYTVRARKSGFTDRSVTVAVREDRVTDVQLNLEEEDEDDDQGAELDVEVESWSGSEDDEGNTSVTADYLIRNVGDATAPEYQITFRIETDGDDRTELVEGELLQAGASEAGSFERDLGEDTPEDVVVDDITVFD